MNDQPVKSSLAVFGGSQKTHRNDSGEIRKDRHEDLLVRLGSGGGRKVVWGPFWLSSGGCLTPLSLDNSVRSEIKENEQFSKSIFGEHAAYQHSPCHLYD